MKALQNQNIINNLPNLLTKFKKLFEENIGDDLENHNLTSIDEMVSKIKSVNSNDLIENLKRNKFNDEIKKSIDPKFFTYLLDNKIKNNKEFFDFFQLSVVLKIIVFFRNKYGSEVNFL